MAKCILKFQNSVQQGKKKTHADIEINYMKIFRFLADFLSAQEFESLSYYHVSRFITYLIKLATDDPSSPIEQPVSLR